MEPINALLMQPFEADHSEILHKIVFEELKQIGCMTNRADSCRSETTFRLQDRVDEFIKKSDICVADLTTPYSPNVLLEVGAALALQIPTIIISNEVLPANIRGNIYLELDPKELSKEEGRHKFKEMLNHYITQAKNQVGRSTTENFIAHGYPDRKGVDFNLLIRRANRYIGILTTNLGYVVSEKLFPDEYPEGRTILEALKEELPKKNNPAFFTRILALDPDSNFTNERADSLHRPRRDFRDDVRNNLDLLKTEIKEIPKVNIDVQIYDEYPLQMTFFFDDVIVNSAVASSRSSRHCVTYVHFNTYRCAQDTFKIHFDELWGRSKPYIVR